MAKSERTNTRPRRRKPRQDVLSQSRRIFACDIQPCKAEPIPDWIQRNEDAGLAYDALPGLSKIINTTTLTPDEKAFFLAIAPEPLQDEYALERVADMVKQGKPQMIEGFVQEMIASQQEDEKREESIACSTSIVSIPSPQSANADEVDDRRYFPLSWQRWEEYRVDMGNEPSQRLQNVDDSLATAFAVEDYVDLHML
jgi:hypothetical protein